MEFSDASFYVGRSMNIESRFKDHCSTLKRNKSTCPLVQKKYLEVLELPTLTILEETSLDTLSSREVHWIDLLDATRKGLNVLPGGTDVLVGDKHPMSKYSNTQIYTVLELLACSNPIYSHKDIENVTGVRATTIKDIVCGISHTWLQENYPTMYNEMLKVKLERKKTNSLSNLNPQANKRVDQYPRIISPLGEVYFIDHLSNFASSHGLQASNLSHVLSGRRIHHKGWRIYDEKI
jgi:hypothetical protein